MLNWKFIVEVDCKYKIVYKFAEMLDLIIRPTE
jgi:hypothetical protein